MRWLAMLAAAVLASAPGRAAAAMNWCAVPTIIPNGEADFDRIVPLVQEATGCRRKASDSAHEASWECEDDPKTEDVEKVLVMLSRVPGGGAHLMVFGWSLQSMDRIRACGPAGMMEGTRFKAGSVAHRDQIRLGYGARRLTLLNMGPDAGSVVHSGLAYGADDLERGLLQGMWGLKPETSPATAVRLAGTDPLATDVHELVASFVRRGSVVSSSKSLDEAFPEWTLTPPIGLAGVSRVEVEGFVRHLLNATYVMAGVPDYERFVGLLDAEYGASRRGNVKNCVVRWWEAGRVTIRGSNCSGEGARIRFANEVAGEQLTAMAAHLDKKKPDPDVAKPVIDRDNF